MVDDYSYKSPETHVLVGLLPRYRKRARHDDKCALVTQCAPCSRLMSPLSKNKTGHVSSTFHPKKPVLAALHPLPSCLTAAPHISQLVCEASCQDAIAMNRQCNSCGPPICPTFKAHPAIQATLVASPDDQTTFWEHTVIGFGLIAYTK